MTGLLRLFLFPALALLAPASAYAQDGGTVVGFGGLSLSNALSTVPNLGGTLTVQVTPGVQVVGEAGRLGNVLPPVAGSLFSLSGTGLRVAAFYGEGGVRILGSPRSRVSPYAEATVGIARLDLTSTRLNGIGSSVASVALGLLGRNAPMTGVGGGVLLRGGPVVFDAGYRFKRLFPSSGVEAILGLGQPMRSHQVRVGVGVRF